MALVYSVANGGFIQASVAATEYLFSLSGELEVPAGLVLPYQYVKDAFTISSVTAIFREAGTSTYTITVTSTDADGANLVTHVSSEVITPATGETVNVMVDTAAVGADRILKVSVLQNSGTPSTDLTITIGA